MIRRLTLSVVTILAFSGILFAQTFRTVNADPNAPSGEFNYSTLQEAIDASVDGDTLFITPNNQTYSATLGKRLVIMGVGLDTRKNNPSLSSIVNIDISSNQADSSRFIGLYLDIEPSSNYIGSLTSIILINYCNTEPGSYQLSNGVLRLHYSIENSLVTSGGGSNSIANSIVQNSYLSGIRFRNSILNNNVFRGSISNSTIYDVNNPSEIKSQFYNNIVDNNNFTVGGATAYTNNLFVQQSEINTIGNGNSSINNLFQVDPQFVNYNAGNNIFDWNLQLQESSPAKNYGTDGSDLGFYGGEFPFTLFDSGVLLVPNVRDLQISGVVKEGGQLKVVTTVSNASNN